MKIPISGKFGQYIYNCFFKGTLMQILKSRYMLLFIYKLYPENFALLILGILELYTRKVCEMFVYKHIEAIEYVKN